MFHLGLKNLTQHEASALAFEYNLADAHTHQSQSITQKKIIERLSEIFYEAERTPQPALDLVTTKLFHDVAFQYTASNTEDSLICYSSSLAMEIVANYLRRAQMTVALIEPTFDNIADILKRHKIQLEPIDERTLFEDDSENIIRSLKSHALFLTLPNNPTGSFLEPEQFRRLAWACKRYDKIVLLDTSFRLFEPNFCYDQYKIFQEEQSDYIVIEDTGKFWPTLDLKVGFLNGSNRFRSQLRDIHSDFLLNVSPFVLRLLCEYFQDSRNDNFESIRGLIRENRNYLRSQLAGTFLTPEFHQSQVSVEFLRIHEGITARELKIFLDTKGVIILPGNYFYWNSPEQGEAFVRVALARDQELFRKAVTSLVTIITDPLTEKQLKLLKNSRVENSEEMTHDSS